MMEDFEPSGLSSSNPAPQMDPTRVGALLAELLVPSTRDRSLQELSKAREYLPDLAPALWFSCGTMAVLLQEILSVYPMLSPPTLTPQGSNRVCNALALMQSVAQHAETRLLFLASHMPLYLYPFLNTTARTRAFEFLRLTSLGVIGALVKADDVKVIEFMLATEIIPLCLRIMETSSELSKTIATFIVQKILIFEMGLAYICAMPERFHAVAAMLEGMVRDNPSPRLLKHIVRCYLRLSNHERAAQYLSNRLPDQLRDNTYAAVVREDAVLRRWLQQLQQNVLGYIAV
eukprot:ANDGO_01628.mRNA.1 Cell differentiation protein rcd1